MMECEDSTESAEDAKKRSAQKLIERYYYQLTTGCGAAGGGCDNPDCVASGKITQLLQPNEAAARALHCFKVILI